MPKPGKKHPKPIIKKQSMVRGACPCPQCGQECRKHRIGHRELHDACDRVKGPPVHIKLAYSVHYCPKCNRYFNNSDMLKIAAPGARHTLAVIAHATGAVIIGKLSYSEAKRYLEEDHSVYVTRATIQKWVNADEETKRLLIESDEESRRRLDNFFR